MNDNQYLNRLFKDYYNKNRNNLPLIELFDQREFGFIPWDKEIKMIRHIGFRNKNDLVKYLTDSGPRHVYSSGTLYSQPEIPDMGSKGYKGCDLIIDIDVDHFYTPCKEDHDYWQCMECGRTGSGMVKKCPKCKAFKIKTLAWICDECLNVAKEEIIKLVFNFLIPDFGIDANKFRIAFSGHRGYHLKIGSEKMRPLTSGERREIADYVSGENISFDILGLKERGGNIFGFSKINIGWAQKIISKIEEILSKPDIYIKQLLLDKNKFNLGKNLTESFLKSKDKFLSIIKDENRNSWAIEGFGINTWNAFLTGIVHEIGVEIDTPVTIDIHRLIRYPGSLHGKTGFKVQEILLNELTDFNPLDEVKEKLDPIVFESKVKTTQKLEILEQKVPMTQIKAEKYGPYSKGEVIEVPHHIAIFLLCKEVAKSI
ncbi:hypothetical protein LCGC14_0867000 [marine sediment metagenome]|uniref:DNA primase small subunit PriS n=1 Tax=marine sediment metagenome TaxID=412755 RepID=A0A0F9P5Q1_9ZZZZ